VTGTLPIVELLAICEAMRVRSRALFEALGRWVAITDDPHDQQLFAAAGHRHAWHDRLWAERIPTIPAEVPPSSPSVGPAAADLAWYADQLAGMLDALAAVDPSIDPVLDPATARLVALVTADLEELQRRAMR
jgi:hypothetical protein